MAPSWVQLASREVQAPDVVDEDEPNQPRKGWQATVSHVVETQFWDGLLPTLSNRDVTLLRSQGGLSCQFHSQCFPLIILVESTTTILCLVAPQIAPPAPSYCAFVRVWPSSRQLGPPPLGMLSCWDPWTKGFSTGDCHGPSAEKHVEGCGPTCSCGS